MSLEPRCRHGNIRSAEPCRDCDERDALRARVAELEELLERVTVQLVARLGTNSSEWATVREVRQTLNR